MISYAPNLASAWPLVHTWPLPWQAGIACAPNDTLVAPATLDQFRSHGLAGAWECNLRDNSLRWSSEIFELFGLSPDAPLHRSETVALYSEESREAMEMLRAYALRHRRGFTLDAHLDLRSGNRRWFRLAATVSSESGRPHRLFGTKRDITAERARRRLLKTAAGIDPLTGFALRPAFEARILDLDRTAFQNLGALLLIDVAQIEAIRRQFGATASDACLAVLAERIAGNSGDPLMIARPSQFQIVVALRKLPDPRALERGVRRLLAANAEPIHWRGYIIRLAPAVGFARTDDTNACSVEELLAIAWMRLKASKRKRAAVSAGIVESGWGRRGIGN